MNRLTHRIHLWRLARMMARGERLDAKISELGERIHRHETNRRERLIAAAHNLRITLSRKNQT